MVTDVEGDGAPEGHLVVHGDGPGLPVDAQHAPDQEVAGPGSVDPLVDQPADVEAVGLDARHLGGGEVGLDLVDHALHGRHAGHLVDDVAVRAGDGQRAAVGAGALGDDGVDVHAGAEQDAGGPGGHHPFADHQPAPSRAAATRGVPAHDR